MINGKTLMPFSELLEDATKQGTKLQTANYLREGKYPIVDQGQEQIAGYTDETIGAFDRVPCIVFGDHTRIIKYLEQPFFLGADGVKVLCPKSGSDNEKYLYYALQAVNIPDTGYNRHFKWLKESSIVVYSREQQDRIVDALDKVNNLIFLRKMQLQKLDDLIKARFVEMFGDPILNQKGFPRYTVDDVIEFQGGSQPDKKHFEYKQTVDNIRLIQIRDYKSDRFLTFIPKSMAKRFCTAEDIMIGRYGPPIFQILQGIEGTFNVALMKATPKMGNREFIRYFLKQDCLLEYLEGLSKRTAGQDGVQMDKLKAYPFPYPPIELQERFATFIERVDKSKKPVQQGLDKLEQMKHALMQKYFG